jgi:hypothetical protein
MQFSASAKLADDSAQDVTVQSVWSSGNRTVATIAEDGLLTVLAQGATTVRASYRNTFALCAVHADNTPSPPSTGAGIVINEFRTRGPNGGNDEFVELRNATSAVIDIGRWKLMLSERSLALTALATLPAGIVLNPGCHFLLTRSAKAENYGGPSGDHTFTAALLDDGGIVLQRADGTAVDAVGMSYEAWYEGIPLPAFGKANMDRSYTREGQDTDNNAADFVMRNASTPTPRGGPCNP